MRRSLGTLFGLFVGLVVVCSAVWLRAELAPAPESGQIALVVSRLLDQHHYNGQRLDDAVSGQLLTNYINALDYNHLIFLQSDMAEFQRYADRLDDSLLMGNVMPAFEVYRRYSDRVEKLAAMAKELLSQPFQFDGDDSIVLDRKEAPWPADEKEQRTLVQQRLKAEVLEQRLAKKKPEEAVSVVTRRYERLLRSVREADTETVLDFYLNALSQTYDPHSQYMTPSSLDNFTIDMKLSLTGIGAVLRSEDGYAKIVGLVPGGPAEMDKRLKVNDRICGVAQGDGAVVDVVDLKLNKVVEMIRGPKGTIVRLEVIPADAADSSERVEITLKRDEIKLTAQEAKAGIVEKPDGDGRNVRLGYIELPSFYVDTKKGPKEKSSTRDVVRLLESLKAKDIGGLIVDLRRNNGGSLTEAVSLTGLFIKQGPVVQVKDMRGRVIVQRDEDDKVAYDGPMVVLVSHASASAAEIFAAALQDYGRAVIVGGESTFGKGTVQQIFELDPLVPIKKPKPGSTGALKLTIQKFYRVSGGSTQSKGVVPDLHLPSLLDVRPMGESTLPSALPYDEVQRSDYKSWGSIQPYLPELRLRSAQRQARDQEFQYVRDDIALVKQQLADKTVSLNESRRLEEKKALTERLEARKQQRQARQSEPLPRTEITLQLLEGKTNTVATLTPKVLEDAARNGSEAEETAGGDPDTDPVFEEGAAILCDYIGLISVVTAHVEK